MLISLALQMLKTLPDDVGSKDSMLQVGMMMRRLMEIESRLLPCGLHVVGSPPSATEAIATLVNIAEIDRPEMDPPIRGLPGILAKSIGRNVEEIYLNNNKVSQAGWSMQAWKGLK